MTSRKNYVCAQAHCSETFDKFTDLKKHEAGHARPENVYTCTFPGCDFTTLKKKSLEIHYARHTGEQRYGCPHGCTFRTHDPSALTRHRKTKHGYVPPPRGGNTRGGRAAAPVASDEIPLSQIPGPSYQPYASNPDPSFIFHNPTDNNFPFTIDVADFNMFSEPVNTASGWTEGCMCPEFMQRRTSEMLGYAYRG
ncbi:uncharacterized protein EDB91DRAFT_502378 [Suillus paluster]|uniref:uncharacterized protein n=1 Tax=Suillus paluster TaxID=48578 RepID=UPI001B865926|nr:uncharacterized protein EDB91DRAFT_502378 [Suillus paluster]KAG1736690.1 hypothetical protein EDB91DRAFT_502378 [Suillus paluster]